MKRAFTLIVFLLFCTLSQAQSFYVQYSGTPNFDSGFTTLTEAGRDFSPIIYSSSTTRISVYYQNFWDYIYRPNRPWKIRFHVNNIYSNWKYGRMYLEMRRIGTGSVVHGYYSGNTPQIFGYEHYTRLHHNNNDELWGWHGIANIPFKFRLRGASVFQGAGDFSATVTFTVYDR